MSDHTPHCGNCAAWLATEPDDELTALRQQVADLRAALNTVLPPWETYRTLPDKAKVRWDSYAGVLKSAYLAATQPQEVQP